MLKVKVWIVFPRPFKMLFKVLAMYRKGQMKLSVRMKLPARAFWYRSMPASLPKQRKRAVQRKPSSRQYWMDLRTALRIVPWFPVESASETMGRRRTEMELVMAEGNRISGRAIPVSTPYTLNALALS